MNLHFEPQSDSESDEHEIIDSVRNTIEDMQPIIARIGARIEGIQDKLDVYNSDLLDKMVSPKTDAFKDFWEHMHFPPTVPFQTVFLSLLSKTESLDMDTRVVRFGKCDADRFAKGIRNHTIFSLIPIVIEGVTLV